MYAAVACVSELVGDDKLPRTILCMLLQHVFLNWLELTNFQEQYYVCCSSMCL